MLRFETKNTVIIYALAVMFIAIFVDTTFAQNQPQPQPQVVGPMVGQVTQSTAQIWMYAQPTAEIKITFAEDRDGAAEKTVSATKQDGPLDAAIATLEGLKPDTRYRYSVSIGGNATSPTRSGTFKTAPVAGKPTQFRIGVTSCMKIGQPQASWYLFLAQQPDLHLTLGDTTYADTTDPKKQWPHHLTYRSLPEFATVLRNIPTYSIWDDHDFGPNNSDGTAAGKENSVAAWRKLWCNPAVGTAQTPGAFYTFSRGDVDFFIVDGRYHRSPDSAPDDENKRMLGDEQFAWLLKGLRNSKAKFKVIASGSTLQASQSDGWRIYTFSRHRLLDAIKKHKIGGVLYLSGDIHQSLVREHHESDRVGYPLIEVISSGIANSKSLSFATLDFDTTLDDPTLRVRIIRGDGGVYEDRKWKLSQLQVN